MAIARKFAGKNDNIIDRVMQFGTLTLAAIVVLGFTGLAAWVTHIITCLREDEWGFLIAGALFFPIAIIHGIGVWLGLW
jgi:hypothetical protein